MKRIDEETLAILSRVTLDGNNILLTCGQLDRKQYLAVNEVLQNIGGKWNKKYKAHVFLEDPTEKLESVLISGIIEPPKQYGYFPTPKHIVEQLVELADIHPNHSVLEPSAGQGAILDCLPKCEIECVELLPDNCRLLVDKGYDPIICDFLIIEPGGIRYDRIVANPPFSYGGHPQADIDHVMHMTGFIKPGGRIVSVMGAGVTFRENKKTVEFRSLVNERGFIKKLPEGSFKESGTNVNTVIVVLDF